MDNKGVNENNQTIPGVKIAPPKEEHIETLVDVQLNEPVVKKEEKKMDDVVAPPEILASERVLSEDEKKKQKEGDILEIEEKVKKVEKKKQVKITGFLLFIIFLLVGVCGLMLYTYNLKVDELEDVCSPVSTTKGSKELDLDSFIVKDLYSKVSTDLLEDLAQVQLNDELKVYLAYRQIGQGDIYSSNCNLFSNGNMPAFTCSVNDYWAPKAFKVETLEHEYKKLFGETSVFPKLNIQLGSSCLGGYQYIESRGEYVEGKCKTTGVTMYSVDKKLVGATSRESTIVLKESVKYYGNSENKLPDSLVSGTYEYTFKLDRNYNYVYVSKELIK